MDDATRTAIRELQRAVARLQAGYIDAEAITLLRARGQVTLIAPEPIPYEVTGSTQARYQFRMTATPAGVEVANVGDTALEPHEAGASVGTQVASGIDMERVSGSTYSTVQHMQDIFHSAGHISGGTITDAGGETVDVAAGTGLLRASASDVATVYWIDFAAVSSQAIPTDTVRYIGVEWNSGSPQISIRSSENWDFLTNYPLGTVVNEGGTLHITNAPHKVGDHASLMIQRGSQTMPLARDEVTGGLALGETGTRNITVSAGALWDGLTRFAISAVDTSGADTMDLYYRDGIGGWTAVTGQTAWPNTQYDNNSGTLQAMTNNWYANLWFYLEAEGDVVVLYPWAQYATAASAEAEGPPTSVPSRVTEHGRIIGRLLFQKSAASATQIDSVFTTQLSTSLAADHGSLAGLGDDDHSIYFLADGTRTMTGNANMGAFYVDVAQIATPADPGAGTRRLFVDSGTGAISVRTSAGSTVSLEAGAGGGEANTASNQGTDGVGVYDTKAGVDLQFRHVAPGSTKITTTLNGKDIDVDVAEANLTLDNIGGTLSISKGGTGQTAQTAAMDALSPTTTKGDVLVDDGTNVIRLAVGTNDQVLTADSAQAAGVKWAAAAGGGSAVLGASSGTYLTAAKSSTAYAPVFGSVVSGTESDVEFYTPIAGTLQNLRVYVAVNGGTGADIDSTAFVRKNGAGTSITVTIGGGATGLFSDTSNTATVAAGDRICLQLNNNNAGGGSKDISLTMWSLELA